MPFTLETILSFAGQSNKWNTAGDAASVVEAIDKHPHLVTLDLENNTLGPEAAKVIGDALAKHPEFKRAHFKDLFTGRLKTEIPLALRYLFSGINRSGAQLLELDLSDNALGPVGVEGMVDFMCSPACYSLQELRLNNNGLGITGGTMLARSLEKLIENSNEAEQPWKLKVFIAGRNRLEKVGAKIFASIFRQLGSLEVLEMPQNGIFHEGIAALAEALSHNPSLRVLNLNDNTFTRKGAVAMAQHLPAMQALEVINFGDCLLKSAGAMALAVVLMPGHLKLRELYLDGNELTAEGALSVVEAVQNKPCLTTLMLDDNLFGDDGRDMIETFLRDVGKFEALGSMENNMDPDSGDEEEDSNDDDDGDDDDDDDDTEDEESDDSPNEDFKPKDKVVLSKPTEKDFEELSSRLQNIVEKKQDDTSKEDDLDIQVVGTVNVAINKIQEYHDSNVIVGPITPVQCTAEQYAAAPSAALLLGLPDSSVSPSALSHAAAITATTTTAASTDPVILSPSQHISAVVQLLMQTAALAHTEDRQLLDAVHAAVRALATALFETARQHRLLSFTANTLLIHLGLIKTEDKSFAVPSDVRGALLCLEQVVKEDFFPRDISNTLEYFLSRPSPRLNAYPAEAERLRAALRCP